MNLHPIACFNGSSIPGTFFLFPHFQIEPMDVYRHTMLTKNQFSEIERKPIRIVKLKSYCSSELSFTGCFVFFYLFIQQPNTGFERTQERFLLFVDHPLYQCLLSCQFGICFTHHLNKGGNKFIYERLFQPQKSIAIPNSTTQNATNYITCAGIGGQLSIGNRESNGANMVGHNTHSNVFLGIFSIPRPAQLSNLLNEWLKNIGIVIRSLSLNDHTKPFETHTRIDHFCRQLFERAINFAVVLHEYKIPDLDHLRMISVHK